MYSTSKIKSRVGQAITWTAAAKFVNQTLTLITMIVVARLLAPRDIGLITLCLIYIQFLENFVDAGLLHALIQYPELEEENINSCFWFLAVLFVIAYIITWFLSPILATIFSEIALVDMLRVISILMFFMPLHIVGIGLLSRNLEMDFVGRVEVFAGIVRAAVSIGLVVAGFGVWGLLYGYILSRCVVAVVAFYKAAWRPRFFYDHKYIRPILDFGLKVTVSRMIFYFKNQIDTILVGRLLGTEILGVYSIGRQIVQQLWSIFGLFSNRIVFPLFSFYQKDRDTMNRIFLKITKILSIIAFPVFLGISAKSEQLVSVVFGSQWLAGTGVLAAMAFIGGFRILSPQGPFALNAIGRPGINIWINIFQLIAFSLAFYIGAITNGLTGVATAWLLASPLVFIGTQFVALSVLDINLVDYIKQMLGPVVIGLLLYGVLQVTNYSFDGMSEKWDLVLSIGISIVLFYAVLHLFYKSTVIEVLDLVKRKKE